MSESVIYNEFIYSLSEQEELKSLKEKFLNKEINNLSGLQAARLLINFELFSKTNDEELHLALLDIAAGNGPVRRYLDYLSQTLTAYLPRREDLLSSLNGHQKQTTLTLYQNYCGWKELYKKLATAGLTCARTSALEMALELSEDFPDRERLAALLKAFDRHEEACQAVDEFLDQPLRKSAPEKAKLITKEFMSSLTELKDLHYPLFYESLSQFVTTTHGQASRALSMLLSAERLYRLNGLNQQAAGETAANDDHLALETDPDEISLLQKPAKKSKVPLLGGITAAVILLGAAAAFYFSAPNPDDSEETAALTADAGSEKAAAATTTAATDNEPEKPAPAPAKEEPATKSIIVNIFTTSSAGVKTCAHGPLTSADCPEAAKGFLLKDAPVTILEETANGWSLIESAEGNKWWIFSGFISGANNRRQWHPASIKGKQVTVYENKALTQPSRFVIKADQSICIKNINDKIVQVASPTKVMGYVSKAKLADY